MKHDFEYGANPLGVIGLALILCGLLAAALWVYHLPWAHWWQWLTSW